MRKVFAFGIAPIVAATLCFAAPAGKPTKTPTKVVDSGSFGVFIGGQRVATEKFEIQQQSDFSVAKAELRTSDNGDKPAQTTELQLAPNGELMKYTWRDATGTKAETVVEPKDEFLIQHISTPANGKFQEVPFLLPHSTMILDDFSFMQRQILAWRYLATDCTPAPDGKLQCKLEKAQFGVLIPQQRSSSAVFLECVGKEKVMIRGTEHELMRVNLSGDNNVDWSMWFDDSNKMVRAVVNGQNTEIVRD